MSVHPVFAMVLLLFSLPSVAQELTPILLRIDLTDATRRLIHVTEQLPVHPGANTFAYPQWIPSQELAGGPIDNLTGLFFHAGSFDGAVVPWRRDLSDPYKFHVVVPERVSSLTASYDILEVPSRANTIGTNHTSSHVVMVEPSEVVLYPMDKPVHENRITATIHLPAGWKAATALRTSGSAAPFSQRARHYLPDCFHRTVDRLPHSCRRPLPPISPRTGDSPCTHAGRLRRQGC